jgi:hypothetical protein
MTTFEGDTTVQNDRRMLRPDTDSEFRKGFREAANRRHRAFSRQLAGVGPVVVLAAASDYCVVVTKGSKVSAERISAWLLFFAAAVAPLPFGSNEPILIPFWCAVLGVCLALAPVRFAGPGQITVR